MKTNESKSPKDFYLARLYLLSKDNEWLDQAIGYPEIVKTSVILIKSIFFIRIRKGNTN